LNIVTVPVAVIVQRGECNSPLRIPVVCLGTLADQGGDVAGGVRTDPLRLIADAADRIRGRIRDGIRVRVRVRGRVRGKKIVSLSEVL